MVRSATQPASGYDEEDIEFTVSAGIEDKAYLGPKPSPPSSSTPAAWTALLRWAVGWHG